MEKERLGKTVKTRHNTNKYSNAVKTTRIKEKKC